MQRATAGGGGTPPQLSTTYLDIVLTTAPATVRLVRTQAVPYVGILDEDHDVDEHPHQGRNEYDATRIGTDPAAKHSSQLSR